MQFYIIEDVNKCKIKDSNFFETKIQTKL